MKLVNGPFTSIFFMMMLMHGNITQPKDSDPQELSATTLQNALIDVRRIITDFPSDSQAVQVYENKHSYTLVKCAKVLYDNARQQILLALQEIDKRKSYWQYQKDHQWYYFLTKSPVKWVTGEKQNVEINNNLELLESQQGELYVLLGLLAESGNVYDHNYKVIFVHDVTKAYEWIDNLVDLLARIKTPPVQNDRAFLARATRLKSKLEKVDYFKDDILFEIRETQIPTRLERNWLKYGTLMAGLGFGYSMGVAEQLKSSFGNLAGGAKEFLIDPLQDIVEEIFAAGRIQKLDDILVPQVDINQAKKSIKIFIDDLHKSWYGWFLGKEIEGIVKEKENGDIVIDTAKFLALSDTLMKYWNFKKAGEAKALYWQLLGLQAGGHTQEQLMGMQSNTRVLAKLPF